MDDQILDSSNRQDFPEDFNKPSASWLDWLKNNYVWAIGVGLLAVLAVVATLFFLRNREGAAPEQPNVLLGIKGPDSMSAGNESEFRIVYTNGENTDLTGITLEVMYPSNFKFVSADPQPATPNGQRFDLPVLRQGQSGEVKLRAKVSGATGESKELRVKLNYAMANFSSNFFTEASFKTTLTAPELELEITGPIDVTNGQNTTFTVNYKNVSGKEFDAAAIDLKYPEGFKFVSASPAPSRNQNYWSLGKIAVGAEGKIEVTGSFIGDPGSEQQVGGDLGIVINGTFAPQIHASARFKLQSSTLSVTQQATPGEIVQLGENIQYVIKYANFGSVGQSNVVVTTTLEGASLDMTKLKSSNGIITGNTITWKSATVPGLSQVSPNQTGELNFTVQVKPTVSTNLKNQEIKTVTSIYSDQVTSPIRGQELSLKLKSELAMVVSGEYVSGALPMRVGQPTTFNISVLITNLSNDLADGALIASMPLPASAWVNVVQPEGEKANVTFDRNASKIRWRLGDVPAFVGKYSPARIVTFQLQVTPSESDRGTNMVLLRDIQATALDKFINKEIQTTQLNSLSVSDLNDDQIDIKGSTVE
jgi:hypothetical protein